MIMTNRDLNKQYLNFITNVKYYRNLNNLTQEQLAEKAGISASYIKQIESVKCYKNATMTTMLNIAGALNVSLSTLFDEPI